jgi:hypothetical protein
MGDGGLLHEKLTGSILGAFFEAYKGLKYGYREHLYLLALERELRGRCHRVAREYAVRVMYKGELLGYQRLDMVVDDLVVVEAKSTFLLDKSASRQLYNYLHATNLEVGLLLHFGPQPKFQRVFCENRLKPHAKGTDPRLDLARVGQADEAGLTTPTQVTSDDRDATDRTDAAASGLRARGQPSQPTTE